MKRSIVIVFDRLPAHWLGCYGNFDVDTPAFDWLATQSVVFDRHFTNAPGSTVHSELITGGFCTTTDAPPVTHLDEIAAVFAEEDGHRRWLWLPETTPVGSAGDSDDSEEPSEHEVEQCDEMLVEILEQIEAAGWSDALLIVTGRRGVNDRTEQSEEVPAAQLSADEPANLLLALLIRHPDVGGFRSKAITQPVDIPRTIASWESGQPVFSDHGESLLQLIAGEVDRIRDYGYFSDTDREGIIADDFILIRFRDDRMDPQLFRQPDDRWLVHDVAVEYPDVVDELNDQLLEMHRADS